MKILAIETSTLLGGIAIIDDASGFIAEVKLNVKSTHSERLVSEIGYIMDKTGLQLKDIDTFAVSIGPGSFTGLRIGVSTVKGFSYATEKPIVAIPTLEALAWNFPFCRYPVCTLLDARKKEVYAAVFAWQGEGFRRIVHEEAIGIERLCGYLNEQEGGIGEKVLFAGEGALLYRGIIMNSMGQNVLFPPPDKMTPSPANVAYLGVRKAVRGEFADSVGLVPWYIRKSEAELKKNG
jgi:tRNA threonylcarbamoyladenosine biosynthesis protein TsaB